METARGGRGFAQLRRRNVPPPLRFALDTKRSPRAGHVSRCDEGGYVSTRQHFPLDLGEGRSPVVLVFWILAGIRGSSRDFGSPSNLNVRLDGIEACQQPRSQLSTIVRRKRQRIIEELLCIGSHGFILDRAILSFNHRRRASRSPRVCITAQLCETDVSRSKTSVLLFWLGPTRLTNRRFARDKVWLPFLPLRLCSVRMIPERFFFLVGDRFVRCSLTSACLEKG